jgi:hypothetical protein
MHGPSDRYGDLSLEDLEGLEDLPPDDGEEISPNSLFLRDEFRTFEQDFIRELDQEEEESNFDIEEEFEEPEYLREEE